MNKQELDAQKRDVDAIVSTSKEASNDLKDFNAKARLEDPEKPKPEFDGIAILGSHPTTKMQAPFDDDRWLIYACSPHNYEHEPLPRFDEWFEIHKPLAHATRAYPYLKYLETVETVWMRDQAAMAYFKGAREYPENEMKKRFGPFFFTSSIAFIMAKAIVDCERLNIPAIGLWGIMQSTENEYTYQRPGIQYFIHKASEAGLKVVVPEQAKGLFEPPKEDF